MRLSGFVCALLLLSLASPAQAQTYEMKLGHFLPAGPPMGKYIQSWADELRTRSDGQLDIQVFPSAQLGPMPDYSDMVRRGQMDIGWILHGATSDRFPLTGLIDIPYTIGSAEIGNRVLNDPAVRKYLDPEHRGVKVLYLFTHPPAQLHTRGKAVRMPADAEGLRIRFPSATARLFVEALGATPVGLPPTAMAENLQKSTIDGVVIDYGGAGIAFKLGGLIDYTTEMYAYATSFGLIMNPASYDRLPDELKQLIDETTADVSIEVGQIWDAVDVPGRQALLDGGMEVVELSEEADAAFRAVGLQVADGVLAEREAAGQPAVEVYRLMLERSVEYGKTSFSFWNR